MVFRRQFLSWFGIGAIASFLPIALAACQDNSNTENEPSSQESAAEKIDKSLRPDGFQALATTKQLDEQGTVLDRKNAAKSVLIFRSPDTGEIAAINPMCTHQGCTVELDDTGKALACPCHGSQFNLAGNVATGPATKPLDRFEVKQEDNLVLVKVT